MELKNFLEYIEKPYNLKEDEFQKLNEIIEKYPFFHTANLLYIKAANNLNKEDYTSLVAKISASVPNRELLFKLIKQKAPEETKTPKKEKKEESETRKEIRKRIKKRRKKRVEQKAETLSDHGLSIHEKLIKNFFSPIIENLKENPDNIGLMPEELAEVLSKQPLQQETKTDKKAERERRQAEREKRMAEKRKRRLEEKSQDDIKKEKEEREKRRLAREKRMLERKKLREEQQLEKTEIKPETKENKTGKTEQPIQENNKADEIKITEELKTTEETISEKEKDPYTKIVTIGSEKNKEQETKEKTEQKEVPEPEEKTIQKEEQEQEDIIVVIEENTEEVEKIEITETKEENTEDKKEDVKIITENLSEKQDENNVDIDDIDSIYNKIIRSKKPAKKQEYDFIEIKEDITGTEEEKTTKENENTKTDTDENSDIIFEIEDTTTEKEPLNIEITTEDKTEEITEDKTEKETINTENNEIFELIEKEEETETIKEEENKITEKQTNKTEKEKEKTKTTDETKETKAADNVFARIEALKKKMSGKTPQKKEENKKDELISKFVKEEYTPKRPSPDEEIDENVAEIAEKKSVEKKPVITELMASIFINQGKFNEAIDIYQKLILKNPEKKDYFAAKIEEAKKQLK